MKSVIKCRLFIEDIDDNRIGAEIIERDGNQCSEVICGKGSCGNHIAIVRDIVHNCEMTIDGEKIITIMVEGYNTFNTGIVVFPHNW